MLATVKTLPVAKLNDVPGMLRRTADKMESGELEIPAMLIMVAATGGSVTCYGFGDSCNNAELVGLLEMGKLKMALST